MQNLDPKSQAYKNYSIELESCKQEAWGYQQAWAEAQQAINDINLSKIEHARIQKTPINKIRKSHGITPCFI